MPTLNFTHFSGAVPRCGGYNLSEQEGVLYFIPDHNKAARRYDPFEDSGGLLLDVVRAGAAVADCDIFMDYCLSHKILPLRDAEFWQYGDFFAAHRKEAQPIIDTLFNFISRYGPPVWEPQSVVTTTYPARYEQRLMTLRQNEDDDVTCMVRYEAAKRACQSTGAVPVCTVVLILLDFYLRFIEGIDDGQFSIRRAEWMISCGQEKTPGLFARVYDLTTCINLAYTMLTAGQGKVVRQCKHCQKFFIADDWRAEYCSPRCRGAYNSKMTRKRVKERKMREGQ